MRKKVTLIDESNDQQVSVIITTRAMQTSILRIASISELKAIVEPDEEEEALYNQE